MSADDGWNEKECVSIPKADRRVKSPRRLSFFGKTPFQGKGGLADIIEFRVKFSLFALFSSTDTRVRPGIALAAVDSPCMLVADKCKCGPCQRAC